LPPSADRIPDPEDAERLRQLMDFFEDLARELDLKQGRQLGGLIFSSSFTLKLR